MVMGCVWVRCFYSPISGSVWGLHDSYVLVMDKSHVSSSFQDYIFHAVCTNQDACYVYGFGTWAEGIAYCQRVHPNARMIEETSDEQRQKHIAEAGAYSYRFHRN